MTTYAVRAKERVMDHLSRKHPRHPTHDYRSPGRYSVTLCTERKTCLFGRIVHRRERLNGAGHMIRLEWIQLAARFAHVAPEDLVVMPNHIHGILCFLEEPRSHRASLGQVVGAFKSLTTRAYSAGVKNKRWRRFEGRLWQRGYFDHIIHGTEDQMRVARYIATNPAHWVADPMYPKDRPWRQ